MEARLKIKKISVVLKKIDKFIKSMYGESNADTTLYGTLLLKTIQYIIFSYIYNPNSDKVQEMSVNNTKQLLETAHYIHLRTQYRDFNKLYKKRIDEIKKNVYNDIFACTNNDKSHPMITLFNYVVLHKEMHIRRPKQPPTKKITQGTSANFSEKCYNSVTTELCEFNKRNVYCSLIFTKLPSDENCDNKDPWECDIDYTYKIVNGKKTKCQIIYPKTENFSVIVSKQWGTMFRLLHNMFHLYSYINMYVLQIVNADPDQFKRFSKMPWLDVWSELVTPEFANVDISQFKKSKGAPKMVVAISEMCNIVVATLYI